MDWCYDRDGTLTTLGHFLTCPDMSHDMKAVNPERVGGVGGVIGGLVL